MLIYGRQNQSRYIISKVSLAAVTLIATSAHAVPLAAAESISLQQIVTHDNVTTPPEPGQNTQEKPVVDGPLAKQITVPQSAILSQTVIPDGPPLKEYPAPPGRPSRSWFQYEKLSEDPAGASDVRGSTYIPVDSTVYPMVLRLYSLGYLDTAYIAMRPFTRLSLMHMLSASSQKIVSDGNEEAEKILASLENYLSSEASAPDGPRGRVSGIDTIYTRLSGISGQTLRDSFHLGQTIANDYGRPYQAGFNNITGFSTINEAGRFSLYVRGEYQYSPSGLGYSQTLSQVLSGIDTVPYSKYNLQQSTIPTGPIASTSTFALQEATLSFRLLGHEISGGKSDAWLGPGEGSAMDWSNNAQNIYSFRINRVEPLHVPILSDIIGPFRYDFFVGSLKGHTDPNSPWIHSETVGFAPTPNVRVQFQRSVIWGGEGHVPVTLHTFLRGFFSLSDTESNVSAKFSAADPGDRFSDFSFSWRLPFLSHFATLYADTIVHDDVTPPSAPRRAAYRPGVYISQFPGLRKFDFRIEGVSTDPSTRTSTNGSFIYWEDVQVQGYTNKGYILGDWIGREAKGGQAWLTYHFSGNEWVQVEYLHKKTEKDFIPGGTSQNQFKIDAIKRLRKDLELNAWLQYEGWKAPIYIPGKELNRDTTVSFQLTWFPSKTFH